MSVTTVYLVIWWNVTLEFVPSTGICFPFLFLNEVLLYISEEMEIKQIFGFRNQTLGLISEKVS